MIEAETIVRAGERMAAAGFAGLSLIAAFSPVTLYDLSVAQLGERRSLMRGDVIGFAALDFVLWRGWVRMVGMPFTVEVTRVHADDGAADASGLRVPTDAIAHLEPLSHRVPLLNLGSEGVGRLHGGVTLR